MQTYKQFKRYRVKSCGSIRFPVKSMASGAPRGHITTGIFSADKINIYNILRLTPPPKTVASYAANGEPSFMVVCFDTGYGKIIGKYKGGSKAIYGYDSVELETEHFAFVSVQDI